jgi:hypothetical protein
MLLKTRTSEATRVLTTNIRKGGESEVVRLIPVVDTNNTLP